MVDETIDCVVNGQVSNHCSRSQQRYPVVYFLCYIVNHDAIIDDQSTKEYID